MIQIKKRDINTNIDLLILCSDKMSENFSEGAGRPGATGFLVKPTVCS